MTDAAKVILDNDENVPFKHSDESDSEASETSSGSVEKLYVTAKKRKCAAVHEPSGLDRIYIDNQKLWRKLASMTAQSEKTEEKMRYAQLEGNNLRLQISTLTTQRQVLKKGTIELKKSIFWVKVQRNSTVLAWVAWLLRFQAFNMYCKILELL